MKVLVSFFAIALFGSSAAQSFLPQVLETDIQVEGETSIFRSLGNYRVQKGLLVTPEQTSEIISAFETFELFTDGVELRLKAVDLETSYLSFQVYQADGVFDSTGETLLPGLQAFSQQGGVLRQLTVSSDQLALTRFFSFSSEFEVIYARRSES